MHHPSGYHLFAGLLLACMTSFLQPAAALESAAELREIYQKTIDRQLALPADEQQNYIELLRHELQLAGLDKLSAQYLLLLDRNAKVQVVMIFWLSAEGQLEFIGASPASSGMKGGFEYFETPLGVFDHGTANLDFRAEGTKNSKGILGYGIKGMRIYDFGWVTARKTWTEGTGKMRLQIHATDPDYLEPRLGSVQSKGCIRIPATLNRLIDHYGILDAGYESAGDGEKNRWLLMPDRETGPWSGRYLVIVDSARSVRPGWSPLPLALKQKSKKSLATPPSPTLSTPIPAPILRPPS